MLGDLSCVIPTKAYDNGAWSKPKIHETPLDVTLVYVPGPLLTNYSITPDLDEVCPNGNFNFHAYYHMLERRLLPGLLHTNAAAHSQNKSLIVTIPGIGCGQFAGNFQKDIHSKFQAALNRLLVEHGLRLTQIKAIWYDNFDKQPDTKSVNGIDFLTRPLLKNGGYHNYVAWDHVSKPGNDYWAGS